MPFVTPDLPQTEAVIATMTNAFRVDSKLAPVAPNAALHLAAQAFADYLARTGTFSHTADGHRPAERTQAAGYASCMVAENIAMHQSRLGFGPADLARRVVEGWKTSAAHRANLLQPGVTETGIGIAQSNDPVPKFLTVQLFGRPGSYKYSYTIENRAGQTVSYTLDAQQRSIAAATIISQTACTPRHLSFAAGTTTSNFETRNGDRFMITRGPDGAARVERITSRP